MVIRSKVLWFGNPPSKPVVNEHSNRGLTLDIRHSVPSNPDLDLLFVVARALVIAYDPTRKGISHGFARELPLRALDHGIKVFFLGDVSEVDLLRAHAGDLPRNNLKTLIAPADHVVAEEASRHDPQLPCNFSLSIKGDLPTFGDEILLRRSFSDCRAITLKLMSGGKSGARVYLVHAEPEPDADVDWSYRMPFFAKIDSLKRVDVELLAYNRFAGPYIAFSHRPNVETRRCIRGAQNGVLVGDFVEGALPLAKMVRPFGARQVIHSLFDDALACFRQQAFATGKTLDASVVSDNIVKPDEVLDIHWKSSKRYGRSVNPHRLKVLIDSAKFKFKAGPIHGDLNAENIFARHNEAVLIDFYRTAMGPLVSDLACLEVAVAFTEEAKAASDEWKTGDGHYSSSSQFIEWKGHVETLFTISARSFAIVPPPLELPCQYSWMWSVCRQLRLMAHYVDHDDRSYAFIVGLHLLRLCKYGGECHEESPDRAVRGLAYFIGQNLVKESLKGVKAK